MNRLVIFIILNICKSKNSNFSTIKGAISICFQYKLAILVLKLSSTSSSSLPGSPCEADILRCICIWADKLLCRYEKWVSERYIDLWADNLHKQGFWTEPLHEGIAQSHDIHDRIVFCSLLLSLRSPSFLGLLPPAVARFCALSSLRFSFSFPSWCSLSALLPLLLASFFCFGWLACPLLLFGPLVSLLSFPSTGRLPLLPLLALLPPSLLLAPSLPLRCSFPSRCSLSCSLVWH